ncbi:MAG: adenylate/guanylate cyclase domain-containing protein [Candidatus Sericytochromatia bacterium]|nr:adenylate/guanylate cyclase domain-containing protein [Candidatus Sericytochromatia bacterium]
MSGLPAGTTPTIWPPETVRGILGGSDRSRTTALKHSCPGCRVPVDSGQRFCIQCGIRLRKACPRCGEGLDAPARFCSQCRAEVESVPLSADAPPAPWPAPPRVAAPAPDAPLSTVATTAPSTTAVAVAYPSPTPTGSATSSDRRIITVLFTDVTGFTAMSEKLDPEEVTRIINDFFKVLVEPIYRYGGVVDKYIGDAIMALFGAPVAHEDDPERAVRAAWDMQVKGKEFADALEERTGIGLKIRIGIHTGLVVAGQVGGNQRASYTVTGDTVLVAQAMEAGAQPGRILVSQDTMRLIGQGASFAARESVKVKDRLEPVEVYEVASVGHSGRTDHEADEVFIGRDDDQDILYQAWGMTAVGRPQAVRLVGDAGSGKSALLRHFARQIRSQSARVLWARCLSFEQETVQAGLADLLMRRLGMSASRPEYQVREDLRAVVSTVLPGDEHAPELLGSILGLKLQHPDLTGLSPRQLRTAAFLSLTELVLAEARVTPVLLVLEDLHWADDATCEWIGGFLDRLALEDDVRVMVALAARTEGLVRLQQLSSSIGCRECILRPLTDDEALTLAALQLSSTPDNLPSPVRSLIERVLERAEGNPFYLGEMLQHLLDRAVLVREGAGWNVSSPGAEGALPTSVRSAIAARLDSLDDSLRRWVQVAAVIGRQFEPALLGEVIRSDPESGLKALIEQKIFHRRSDGSCGFNQAMAQEVAYENLLLANRRELHRKVGRALEEQGIAETQPMVLAQHFLRAEEPEPTVRYLDRAAEQAHAGFANAEAQKALRTALDWLPRCPGDAPDLPDRSDLLLRLARTETQLGNLDAAQQTLGELDELGIVTAEIAACKGVLLDRKGELEPAITAYAQACALTQDPAARARAMAGMADIHRRLGQYPEAMAKAREAYGILEELGRSAEAALMHSVLGLCLWRQGDLEGAMREHAEAMRLRVQAGDIQGQTKSANNLGVAAIARGRWGEALEHFERSVMLARRLGDRVQLAMASNNLGDLLLKSGDDDGAERAIQQALKLAEQTGNVLDRLTATANLAELHMVRSEHVQALELFDVGLRLMAETGADEFAPELWCHRGRALLGADRLAEAREALEKAVVLGETQGNTSATTLARSYLAEVTYGEGRTDEAVAAAREALAQLREQGNEFEIGKAMLRLMPHVAGPEAEQLRVDAAACFRQLGARRELAACGAAD